MKRWLAALLAALVAAIALAAPAGAQLDKVLGVPLSSPSPSPTASPQAIADTQDAGADARIAGRIRGIFAELPAFAQVRVAARQGVVTLSGTVPQQADVARAEAIAGRVAGVVTVDNGLKRDVSAPTGTSTIAAVKKRFDGLIRALPLIGVALGVGIVIALIGYGFAGLRGFWRKLAPNVFLAELIGSAIRFIFVLAGLVVALNMLGAGALLGAVLGGAGVVGLALGFALRDTIENYVASLMLSLRQPFRPNDHIVIDEQEGRVIRLTSRATILMTMDGNHLRIPNSQVFKAVILNYTRNPRRRFEFELPVDTHADALAARKIGCDTLAGLPYVVANPAATAVVAEAGVPNTILRFQGWVDQRRSDFGKARGMAIIAVKSALEQAGLGLPEAVYNLRFEPDSPALPAKANAKARSAPAPQSPTKAKPAAPAKQVAEAKTEDVRPADEVKDMVEAERANAPKEDNDLLDRDRPVE